MENLSLESKINGNIIDEHSIDDYYELENKIKDMLLINLEKQFKLIYEKLSDKEKMYFNLSKNIFKYNNDDFLLLYKNEQEKESGILIPKLILDFNINNVKTYRGDLSSSSLQQFFHLIFKDNSEFDVENFSTYDNSKSIENILEKEITINLNSELKSNYLKFKTTFTEIFTNSLLLQLNGGDLIFHNYNLSDYISKFENKNGYLNVFLIGMGKTLIDNAKNKIKKEKIKIKEKVDDANQFVFNAMGHIESCFPEKFSVPRQGNILELTRAKIVMNKKFDMSSFDGIEEFDYIWIVYVFHLNTNFGKAKISPPKYEGKKLGVFATRSPHRMNPIGLTLAKFEKIDKNEILISSVDMISGTPVLDIKPYHHLESIDIEKMKYPDWIKNGFKEEKKANVTFTETSTNSLKSILQNYKLTFYDNFDELVSLIKGILEIDPHSKFSQKKKDTQLNAFYIDKLNVVYEYNPVSKEVLIQNIEYYEEYKKLRNKSWLDSYTKNLV